MAGAASAHQAATATREDTSQQRAGRTRRTSADPQRAQQGATAATTAAPAARDSLSRMQQLADASPQVAQLQRLQALAEASPRVAQLRRLQALADARFAPVAQLKSGPEDEELLQGKFASTKVQPQLQQAPRANNTGLPDQLKSGIESLSGLSMDHVRVHYNSGQPEQLNALAYAQGSDIHLAPGQEQHLPHEAWHVVQQAQGRVRPTLQLKDGVPVNDEPGLEREADVMGSKALEGRHRVVEAHRSVSMPIEPAQQLERDTTNSPDVNVANNHSAPLANGPGLAQRGGNEMQRIADQRPEAALQRQVQAWGDGSPERVGQLLAWQGVAVGMGLGGKRQDLTPGFALAAPLFAPVAQLAGGPEEEELIQGQFAAAKPNKTGLPDNLKSVTENFSDVPAAVTQLKYPADVEVEVSKRNEPRFDNYFGGYIKVLGPEQNGQQLIEEIATSKHWIYVRHSDAYVSPLSTQLIVFDPVAKISVVPDDKEIWEQFINGFKKSNGKMNITFKDFAANAVKKAEKEEAGKHPVDINDKSQLAALWGSSSTIDKAERVLAIAKMFTDAGYEVINIVESSRSSSNTPPMLFDIRDHPTITKFEIHPGGGIHNAPYIRISTQKGMIKIINTASKPAYDRLTEKNVMYVEVTL